MNTFASTLGIASGAKKINLLGEFANLGGEGEEGFGERFAEAGKFGVVTVFGVVFAAVGCWLLFFGGFVSWL